MVHLWRLIEVTFIFQYDYALRHLYALVNLCENNIETTRILQAIYRVCA